MKLIICSVLGKDLGKSTNVSIRYEVKRLFGNPMSLYQLLFVYSWTQN